MGKTSGFQVFLREYAVFYALGILISIALKVYYCFATSDHLQWVLSPTAALVEILSGIHFEREAHAGFMSREHGLILAPACAGVNFLIIAFSALCFSNLHRLRGSKQKLFWIGISGTLSYFATVLVNALRIIASVFLYHANIYGGWVTPERVHRTEGILVYFFFLILLNQVGERIAERLNLLQSRERRCSSPRTNGPTSLAGALGIPFLCYMVITVAVPVLNQAWRHHAQRFVEHCVLVPVVCLVVLLLLLLFVVGYRGIGFVIRKLKGTRQTAAPGAPARQ